MKNSDTTMSAASRAEVTTATYVQCAVEGYLKWLDDHRTIALEQHGSVCMIALEQFLIE